VQNKGRKGMKKIFEITLVALGMFIVLLAFVGFCGIRLFIKS